MSEHSTHAPAFHMSLSHTHCAAQRLCIRTKQGRASPSRLARPVHLRTLFASLSSFVRLESSLWSLISTSVRSIRAAITSAYTPGRQD